MPNLSIVIRGKVEEELGSASLCENSGEGKRAVPNFRERGAGPAERLGDVGVEVIFNGIKI